MACRVVLLFMLLLQLLHTNYQVAAVIPAVIIFGDSTVDTGNNNWIPTLLKSNFPPYGRDFFGGKPTGRFSNGRLSTDVYSELFGLRPFVPAYLDPAYGIEDFATGVCFASAGTGLDNVTADMVSVIPLWMEVEFFKEYRSRLGSYLGEQKARWTLHEAVYVVSIGTNDIIENYYSYITERHKQFTIDEYMDFLILLSRNFITDIYRLGARKIGFTGLSPMGCVPLERTMNFINGGACLEEYNRVGRAFNEKLKAAVAELCATLPGIKLRYAHVYDFFLQVVNNPSLYGFENVDTGCCGTGRFELGFLCNELDHHTCPDASKYAFWDAVHPTEKFGGLVVEYLVNTTFWEFF